MSLLVGIMGKDYVFMAADTRISKEVNSQIIDTGTEMEKLRIIHGKLVFAAGNADVSRRVMDEYELSDNASIENLSSIAKRQCEAFEREAAPLEQIKMKYGSPEEGKDVLCCIIVTTIKRGKLSAFQMASFNGFALEERMPPEQEGLTCSFVGGVGTEEVHEMVKKLMNINLPIEKIARVVFNMFESPEIGGYLNLFEMNTNGICRILREKIVGRGITEEQLNSIGNIGGA